MTVVPSVLASPLVHLPQDLHGVAVLARPAVCVQAGTGVPEVDRIFRQDATLRSVVVRRPGGLDLLAREQFERLLTGALGFGRALHNRRTVGELCQGSSLSVDADTSLTAAAQQILARSQQERYLDVLVLGPDGEVGTLAVSDVFAELASFFRGMALQDPLTGLPNRRALAEHGELVRLPVGAGVGQPTLLYVDLDGFKDVNDALGHQAGDEILVRFAERLRSCVRPGDIVARLGGDEFAVLLAQATEVEANAVAERVVLVAAAPYVLADDPIYLSASVGVALLDEVGSESALTPLDVLLRQADAAMLRAKRAGRSRVARLSRGSSQDLAALGERAAIRRRLRAAVEQKAFTLHYQPRVHLSGGGVPEFEALLRWTDAELGSVSPADFIPVAESTGLILPIGRWVLDEACRQAALWRGSGHDRRVAVNISAVELADAGLADHVGDVLRRHALPAERLDIEITETTVIQDLDATLPRLRELRALGVRLSLDDFGTGYSSLAMLSRLPLDVLKIDMSFLHGAEGDLGRVALLRLIVNTAHELGLRAVAEGVETPSQLALLQGLGCDGAQGFLLGRPCPAADLDAELARAQRAGAR